MQYTQAGQSCGPLALSGEASLSSGVDDVADTVLLAGDRGGLDVPDVGGTGGETPLLLAGCWRFDAGISIGTEGVLAAVDDAVTGDHADVGFFVGLGAGRGCTPGRCS